MKKATKKSTTNQDAVTVKDLEKEITDLRIGLANLVQTVGQFADANQGLIAECRNLKIQLAERGTDLVHANEEIVRQQEFQSRAHETIELLVKKMPYAPQVQ